MVVVKGWWGSRIGRGLGMVGSNGWWESRVSGGVKGWCGSRDGGRDGGCLVVVGYRVVGGQ